MNDRAADVRKTSWIPGVIRHDFPRKLIALCFAALIWWNVSLKIGVDEVIRNVPVTVTPSDEIVNLSENVKYVDLTIRGRSQKHLNRLSSADFKIEIPVRESMFTPGRPVSLKVLKNSSVSKPFGVSIVGANPESIVMVFDRRITRELPVAARFTGTTSDDYSCDRVEVVPAKVKASGPESIVLGLAKIQTEPIVLNDATENFEYPAALVEPHPKVAVEPRKVQAQVEISRKYDIRTFSGAPLSVLGDKGGNFMLQRMSPATVDVAVRGGKGVIENMSITELRPFVDLSGVKEAGSHSLKVECFIGRQDVKVNSINPQHVQTEVLRQK